MRIRCEAVQEQPFTPGCDVLLTGPFPRPLDADQEREALVTLVGCLLDGGYADD